MTLPSGAARASQRGDGPFTNSDELAEKPSKTNYWDVEGFSSHAY
jgi:hypothetical protein